MPELLNHKIAIIGLGYVGLPLAIEFGKKYKTIGFDININRIQALQHGNNHTQEADLQGLQEVTSKQDGLSFSNNIEDIKQSNVFIVTVPTPIDQFKAPDLKVILPFKNWLSLLLEKFATSKP